MSEVEIYECFNKQQKDYLISITVHKAKNLHVFNADTFVEILFNDEIKRTRTYRNSDCPFFNEYFVFEIRTSLENLLRKNIHLAIIQESHFLKRNSIIGELNVNLCTVWKQNYHTFVKKWGVLEKIGSDHKNETAGYIQLDLSIVTTSEPPAPSILQSYDNDIIEENLLHPSTIPSDPENVKYLVNIFDGTFTVKRDYIIQVTYGSFRTKTRAIKYAKYCKWNEQMIFNGKFQSLNQMMTFELLIQDYYQWRTKCSVELNFNDMCWSIHGMPSNKPSFGPAQIKFYEGAQKNAYYGKLLVSITTEDVDEKLTVSSLQKKQDIIIPLNENEFWNEEIFKINMIILSADSIDVQHNNIKAFLTCEDFITNTIDLNLKDYKFTKLKFKYAEFESNVRPLMTLSIKLQDNRLKNQANNLIKMLSREMESNIKSFKLFEARYFDNDDYQVKCLKMLHNDLKNMLEGLKIKTYNKTFKKLTDWDSNFLEYVQYTLDKCINIITSTLSKSNNKAVLFQEYLNIRDILSISINDVNIAPADVILNVTKDNKLLAFHRFKTLDYVYSQAFDSKGQFCGKIKSIVIKPATCMHSCENCGCMFGKFEIIMWIGSDKEVSEFLPQSAIEVTSNKINFTAEQYWKCNVYVHQAKIRPIIDKNNLCHPKLIAVLNGMSEHTRVINQSLSIVWNEVLIIENVKNFDIGDDKYYDDYPSITLHLYDEDKKKFNLIGSAIINVCIIKANDKEKKYQGDIRKLFNHLITQSPPQLRWITFHQNGMNVAEVLMSAEFIQLTTPTITIQERDLNDSIPIEIRPNIRKFHVEVTFVGLRDASKNYNFASNRYKIEFLMGELMLSSNFSTKKYKKNVNFLDPHCSGYILLPEQFQYWPPIIIKHSNYYVKHSSVIGAAMIRRPEKFFIEDKPKELQRFLLNDTNEKVEEIIKINESEPLLGKSSTHDSFINIKRALSRCRIPKFLQINTQSNQFKSIILENEYTWWTKFYNSNREENLQNENLHSLKIFHSELEKQPEYEYLNDWAYPIDMFQAKHDKSNISEKYAKLKCSIKITKCWGKEFFETEKLNMVPSNFRFKRIPNLQVEIPILIRVYIVQAINLRSYDVYSHSDAFIKIDFGNQSINDRAHYISNKYSPIFGRRYQVNGIIPKDTQLKIAIYDRDSFSNDDLIGKTKIDIEDRLRTKYGASCGIMKEYNSTGYNAWRHSQLPSEILNKMCEFNELSLPQYFPDHAVLAGIEFKDSSQVSKDGNIKERLALSMLHNFDKIHGIGYKLIPEHVETRSLHRKDRPGIEQGKLLMWIEIFDPKKSIPEPVDITPIPPRNFELRVIIWNSKDVILNDRNIFGKSMSDIYIKGWMENVDNAQFTDVHYRSLTGEGNFNWRMIFNFKYSIGEDMMVITRKKSSFEKFDTELKIPAVLNLQVWDNDSFSPDDFLGAVAINISHFPQLAPSHEKFSSKKLLIYDNLFAIDGSIRGWCSVYGKEGNQGPIKVTGKLEIELEVLSEEKAKLNPAGKGRDGPNQLPLPK
ncbi:hypothetical protein PVAND_008861 [Polypedilum vanderplanki]|uniref:C2 domain-containing protein n=1 Tax=Polypedilum vanderplanki TaxID=319348 RepID=A0A9J6CB42_POLVA|nr:hypothetical protein PVAND_008861 [Polypedilum vanderplanki]